VEESGERRREVGWSGGLKFIVSLEK